MSTTTTTNGTLTGDEIIDLCRRHTLFEWSAQSKVDPIPMARAKGVYFWTTEGKRYIDFNSQLMCVNVGHSHERVIGAIQEQAATMAYANRFMATEVRARLGAKLAGITPGDIDVLFFTNGGADANENAIKLAAGLHRTPRDPRGHRSYHGGTIDGMNAVSPPGWLTERGIMRPWARRGWPAYLLACTRRIASFRLPRSHTSSINRFVLAGR